MTFWILGETKRSDDNFSGLDSLTTSSDGQFGVEHLPSFDRLDLGEIQKLLGRQFRLMTGLYGQTVQRFLTVQHFISTEDLKKRSTDGSAAFDSVAFHLDREILRKNSADGFVENL